MNSDSERKAPTEAPGSYLLPLKTFPERPTSPHLFAGKPAVFVDRDGVVVSNVTRSDGTIGSPRTQDELEMLSTFPNFARAAHEAGYALVIVTNQPDIARGHLDPYTYAKMNEYLISQVPELDAIYACPHDTADNCTCRKPRPGLIKSAISDLSLRVTDSWMIGDRSSDIEAGAAIPLRSICLPTQTIGQLPTRTCKAAVPHIHANELGEALAIITH